MLRWLKTMHLDPGAREFRGDVRLQVRESEHEVGLERADAVDLRAREGGHAGLLAPRARRAHGEPRDADDAPILSEEVERLRRLFRQADDAFRIAVRHRRTVSGPQLRAPGACATLPR